jgi:hypothetical protein
MCQYTVTRIYSIFSFHEINYKVNYETNTRKTVAFSIKMDDYSQLVEITVIGEAA